MIGSEAWLRANPARGANERPAGVGRHKVGPYAITVGHGWRARYMRGRPRPRVAMMLRWISLLPLSIVSGIVSRYQRGKSPCIGAA